MRRTLLLARIRFFVMACLFDTVSCLVGLGEDVDVRDPPRALPRNNLVGHQGSWQTWLHVSEARSEHMHERRGDECYRFDATKAWA